MRRFNLVAMVAGMLLCGACGDAAAEGPSQKQSAKPNFVFIIADDCTFRDLGCYGGQAHTPHIDKLATQGMRMKQCFQAAPMCSPTRHNIYTGLYPVKSGAYPNHTFVKAGTRSIVQYLKPLGYRVALSGKRHIAPRSIFDFEYSTAGNNPDFGAIDKLMGDCREKNTPFCLFACSNEPHSPWNKGDASRYPPQNIQLPPYFVDTDKTRDDMSRYLAEITFLDQQVGRCLELLDKHQLADNTLVVFVSEQGSGFPFGKWTCYDTGLQSAMVARWPGKIPAGRVSSAMVEYVDVVPTFLEAAGAKIPADLDGKSMLPVLAGKVDTHKDHVFGIHTTLGIINGSKHFGIRSVRSEQYKYILNLTPEVKFTNACTKSVLFQSWVQRAASDADAADKVRRYQHRPAEELYRISDDPYEWKNLADDPKLAGVKAELRRKLEHWMMEQGDRGQATELAALEHQNRGRTAKQGQKKRGQKKRGQKKRGQKKRGQKKQGQVKKDQQDTAQREGRPPEKKNPARRDRGDLPELPRGITSFGGAVIGDHLYVYGGHFGGAHHYSNTSQSDRLMRLNLRQPKGWEQVAKGPRLQGLAMVAYRDQLYRIGGFTAHNDEGDEHDLRSVDSFARFDPRTGRWDELPNLPEPRSSHDAVVIGDTLYVVGGWQLGKSSTWHKTAWSIDLSKSPLVWRAVPPPPFQRRALALGQSKGVLYAIGGMQKTGGPTTTVVSYDPASKSWKPAGSLAGKGMEGFGSSAFHLGDDLYVSTYGGNLQRLSPDRHSWELVKKLEVDRFFHRMLAYQDQLILVGGASMEEGKRLGLETVAPNGRRR